jgi:hypothetical protein
MQCRALLAAYISYQLFSELRANFFDELRSKSRFQNDVDSSLLALIQEYPSISCTTVPLDFSLAHLARLPCGQRTACEKVKLSQFMPSP